MAKGSSLPLLFPLCDALAEEATVLGKGSNLPLPFSLGDALSEEAKALAKGSSLLLVGKGGLLTEELLAAGSLLVAGASGLLLEYCLIIVLPQYVNGPLPIPVGAVHTSTSPMKSPPPCDSGGSNPAACWSS